MDFKRPTTVVSASQGRVFHAFGDELTMLLNHAQTGGQFTAFTDVTPPGGGPPPHFHDRDDEWFFVLAGRVSFLADGQWTEVAPGGMIFAPHGGVHTFRNIGETPSKILVHVAPGNFENFFAAAAAEFAQPGGPDMNHLVQIAGEYGIHFAPA